MLTCSITRGERKRRAISVGVGRREGSLAQSSAHTGVQGGFGDSQKAQDRHLKTVWGENDEEIC